MTWATRTKFRALHPKGEAGPVVDPEADRDGFAEDVIADAAGEVPAFVEHLAESESKSSCSYPLCCRAFERLQIGQSLLDFCSHAGDS